MLVLKYMIKVSHYKHTFWMVSLLGFFARQGTPRLNTLTSQHAEMTWEDDSVTKTQSRLNVHRRPMRSLTYTLYSLVSLPRDFSQKHQDSKTLDL